MPTAPTKSNWPFWAPLLSRREVTLAAEARPSDVRLSLSAPGIGLLLAGACLLLGCSRQIGDQCTTSYDCTATTADRICDTTQPKGYCTKFACEPGTCPDEASCIAFHGSLSPALPCREGPNDPRLRRTFCLRRCDSSSNCREGYTCANLGDPSNPWSAELLETARGGKVCVVPFSAAPTPTTATAEVCSVPVPADWPAVDLGLGGAGGAGGAGTVAGTGGR